MRLSGLSQASIKTALRYGGVAFVAALLATLILAPLSSSLIEDWSRRDAEQQSSVVFKSIGGILAKMLNDNERGKIEELFDQIAADGRIVGVAYCGDGRPGLTSRSLPHGLSCSEIEKATFRSFSVKSVEGRRFLVATFPLVSQSGPGHFVVVQDLAFAEKRGHEARNYLSLALGGIVLGSGLLTVGLVLFLLRTWLERFREALSNAVTRQAGGADPGLLGPLDKEIHRLLQQVDVRHSDVDEEHAQWTKETLRDAMATELPGAEVIVVANREPYIHEHGKTGIELQTPASGLVAALEPVMRACGGTWIAHGSGSADHVTVDARDRIAVPPGNPEYMLRRIWVSEEEQDGFYYGLANEGLWPLCHIAFTRPVFRESDWQMYRSINERFADAVVAEAKTKEPVVLVQDYHFALLPKLIRDRLPDATIITFWHIPWPNSETFGIFPWKEDVIEGLLGSSVLGFHTQFHCNNFLETVDRFVESRIDREHASVSLRGEDTLVRPYPISIEWPPAAMAGQKPVEECRLLVKQRLGIPAEAKIAVGIERFDYTKGVLDRMRAVDSLLEWHPEWRGRFVMLQAAAPTRGKLAAYQGLQEEAILLARDINEKYTADGAVAPIQLVIRHHEPDEVFELFRAADICVVSSLHDGMNLVAKEFIAARDDERGALVLSHFTGASRELSEALIINPYDTHDMGEVLHQALKMPLEEQQARMRLMRSQVRSRNVYRWAGQMLLDASRLRKKLRILRIAAMQSN